MPPYSSLDSAPEGEAAPPPIHRTHGQTPGRAASTIAPRPRSGGAMAGRFLLMFLGLILVIAIVGGVWFQGIMKMKAAADAGAFEPPPAAVTTYTVHPASWLPMLHAIGSLEAVQGVTVSADLPGIIKEINFESGKTVRKGDILVRLVTDQEQAQVESAQAQRDLAVYNLKRQRDLRDKNTNSQSDFDTAEANERQMEAMVSNARAAIDRKTIRAPFDGSLGIRKASLGQFLNSGDPVVSLQSMDPIYVNFSLPQQNMKDFSVGSSVEVHTDATGDQVFAGKITAINSLVDESTRNFQAQATLANPGGKLRPGMFANVDILLAQGPTMLPIPASAINYAPYGNSVFVIVKDMVDTAKEKPKNKGKPYLGVSQQFVKTGQTKGDLVAVITGLKDGDVIVSSGVFKLQNKAAVQINDSVKPEADANPNPDES